MSRVSGKPYFLYILWSESAGKFYIGITEDPHARLIQHNSGVSKWTAKYRPWRLVHVEEFPTSTGAREREILLKKQKGGNGFYKLTGPDPSQFRFKAAPPGS
jgi:putative endonuclease